MRPAARRALVVGAGLLAAAATRALVALEGEAHGGVVHDLTHGFIIGVALPLLASLLSRPRPADLPWDALIGFAAWAAATTLLALTLGR